MKNFQKLHKILLLLCVVLLVASFVDSKPAKKKKPKDEDKPKEETDTTPSPESGTEGGNTAPSKSSKDEMVDSATCKGVKCLQPSADKKCKASNATTTAGGPTPTVACCPVFVCNGENGVQYQFAASSGAFPNGPPGFGYPGPGYPNGPPQGPPGMQNYQFQQQSAFMTGPGSQAQQNGQAYSSSFSNSYSYGTPPNANGNNMQIPNYGKK